MVDTAASLQAALPSVDRTLGLAPVLALIEAHGRAEVTACVRVVLAELREAIGDGDPASLPDLSDLAIAMRIASRVEAEARPSLRPVFNLTGTVLHTNLGRAMLPEVAIEAWAGRASARAAANAAAPIPTVLSFIEFVLIFITPCLLEFPLLGPGRTGFVQVPAQIDRKTVVNHEQSICSRRDQLKL